MRNFNIPESLLMPLQSPSLMAILGICLVLSGDHAREYPTDPPSTVPVLPTVTAQMQHLQENPYTPNCNFLQFAVTNPENPSNVMIDMVTAFETVPGAHHFNTATYDFGDGTTDTADSINTYHSYQNPGRYTVKASFTVIAEKGVRHPTDFEPIVCPPQDYVVYTKR